MDAQRLSIRGRILQSDDAGLQDALAAIHDTAERPRCLCVPGGVEMYVAFHHRYIAKRMPAAMLFTPSIGGISHHWAEDTKEEDLALCCQVLGNAAAKFLAG